METAQGTRSLEQIYDAYKTSIASYVRHQAGDAELAADLVQEIFIKVNLALASLDPERNIAAWLYHIARNTVIDEFRRRKRAAVVLHLSALEADLVDLRSTARQE